MFNTLYYYTINNEYTQYNIFSEWFSDIRIYHFTCISNYYDISKHNSIYCTLHGRNSYVRIFHEVSSVLYKKYITVVNK